jgi:uncharacterized protein (DUF885 family)
VDEIVANKPTLATLLGVPGYDHLWDDLSPQGHAQTLDLARRQRTEMAPHLAHADRWQRHAARVIVSYLDEILAAYERREHLRQLRHTAGDFDDLRDTFDRMDTRSEGGWANVVTRLETFGQPLTGLRDSLEEGRLNGLAVARRQVLSVIDQAKHLTGPTCKWHDLLIKAQGAGLSNSERLSAAISTAQGAVAEFAEYLETVYLPAAPVTDGVGRDRYIAEADRFVGLAIDPVETYEWGWEEVRRLDADMKRVAASIDPDRDLAGVIELLETDAAYAVPSQEAFVEFIQNLQDEALLQLENIHFDVPPGIRSVSVNLVPPGAALGAYYLPPSEDFTRPGGIWYSFGDRQQIPLWGEVSTGYHEGFPGHHLQIGTVMALADDLSRFHRLLVWYSGYGEGWALYTERLMDELGYFERPEYLLGMLGAQQLRACRVVIDIGCHLGYKIPDHSPIGAGEKWTYDHGVEMLHQVAGQPRDVSESELKRYLGWPGQAISYKVGERVILEMRAERQRREGARFDLKEFHRSLLGWGEVRLDYLRELQQAAPS